MGKSCLGDIHGDLKFSVAADPVTGHEMTGHLVVAFADAVVIAGFECGAGHTGDLNGIADDVIGLWLLNVDAHDDSCCQARGVPSSPDRDRSDVCGHHLVPPPWLVTPKRRSRTHVMIKLSSHEIQGASIGLRPHWKL